LNGEKLWCTNGTIAEVILLLAKVEGKVTAFILEMDRPGVEILHRCEFLGCRGIENGWIRFTNVRVPAENVVGEVGKGLKLALSTLNTGRISLAGLCLGMAKQAFAPTVEWSKQRQTFGKPIGYHELNTHKLARMAGDIFAMEAIDHLVAGMIDRADADYRVEAAVAKLFCSERLWEVVDAAMQIRGGRGYEKADSLQARGESPVPIEQLFRDARLYLIGEGSSEILKLFIAREVWDPHIKRATAMFESTGLAKLGETAKVGRFYASWYVKMVAPSGRDHGASSLESLPPTARAHLAYVRETSRRLARNIFYLMVRHGTRLEPKQALVARLAEIGVDLFAITAASLYSTVRPESAPLAAQVFDDARDRIGARFRALRENHDSATTRLGLDVLSDAYGWVLNGSLATASVTSPAGLPDRAMASGIPSPRPS
ncbi:MAG: acyl-CoA dehydrogenase family protein, partial [Chloroflexota bacterium]